MPLEDFRKKYPHLSDDQIADLADITVRLGNKKDTRKDFLSLMKKENPALPIPEIDGPAMFEAEKEKLQAELKALRDERESDKFAASLASQKNEAKSKFGLTDEDFTKMEEMMKKGELPADYRFAPPLYKQQLEEATPTNYGTGGYGPFDLNGKLKEQPLAGLMEDPDSWAQKQAHSMIEDFARNRNRNTF